MTIFVCLTWRLLFTYFTIEPGPFLSLNCLINFPRIVRVRVNPKYYRPTEVEQLQGDASKAERCFGWKPLVKFDELVTDMMESDLKLMKSHPDA